MIMTGCKKEMTESFDLYVGTYGDNLYRTTFTPGTGGSGFSELIPIAAKNPSYLATGNDGLIFAVNECGSKSSISAFRNGSRVGFCNEIGEDPCYVTVNGNLVVTADYSGGSMSVFQADADGALNPAQSFIYYDGSGVVAGRQESAHIHQTRFIPREITSASGIAGEWLLASDLGCDSIHLYKLDNDSDTLFVEHAGIYCGTGSGPRHMEFSAIHGMLFCITELSGEIISWKIGAGPNSAPVFAETQRLKADAVDAGGSADIHISADGRFLYTSHRLKNDGIATFSIDRNGKLERAGYTQTGTHPRNFLILPDGRTMLVAVRDSHQIEVYNIDPVTGVPTATGQVQVFPSGNDPVCLILAK